MGSRHIREAQTFVCGLDDMRLRDVGEPYLEAYFGELG